MLQSIFHASESLYSFSEISRDPDKLLFKFSVSNLIEILLVFSQTKKHGGRASCVFELQM